MRGRKFDILEVGSFEGCSATWILDTLMNHSESRMTVIDTFEGGMEHQNTAEYDMPSIEDRFWSNVSKCEHVRKLRVMKARSEDALIDLKREGAGFDLIYIDASHVAIDFLHDAVLCWRMLNQGGILVFDDVVWKGYLEDCYNPRVAIESFAVCAKPELEVLVNGMQLWARKVENHIPATPNPDPGVWYAEEGCRNLA